MKLANPHYDLQTQVNEFYRRIMNEAEAHRQTKVTVVPMEIYLPCCDILQCSDLGNVTCIQKSSQSCERQEKIDRGMLVELLRLFGRAE